MIKEKNEGVLKGIKIVKFHKLLKLAVDEIILQDKQTQKDCGKSCPVCFRIFSRRQAVERHMVVHEECETESIEEELHLVEKDLSDCEEMIENEEV